MTTEASVKHTLSTGNDAFYPASTIWINCYNLTYQPHSNECGPRTLLALTIQALHQQPHNTMLLPYLHSNLA